MGRRLSEERLLAAAGDLLVDVGPHGATVREIARRAGVNHGLVHHYFGSKEQLLRAAMIVLLEEHRAYVKAATDGGPLPRPLGLLDQQRYLRAIAHCVLDGELELAALEATEGVSVPRSSVMAERSNSGALGSSAAGASGALSTGAAASPPPRSRGVSGSR
mgnify:CR=1 FL=1